MGTPRAVKVGPGLLYVAPVGTAAPTAGTGDAEAGDWEAIGYTEEGHTFTSEPGFEKIMVAEELRPIRTEPSGWDEMIAFAMAEYTVRNLAIAFGGGTIGTPSGGTVTFEPPELGEFTPIAILWQGDDLKEALLCKNCTQSGSIETARRKSPDKALIAVEFSINVPDDGSAPWTYYGDATLPHTDPH